MAKSHVWDGIVMACLFSNSGQDQVAMRYMNSPGHGFVLLISYIQQQQHNHGSGIDHCSWQITTAGLTGSCPSNNNQELSVYANIPFSN